ncbi:hypothetical protein JCM3765_000916 [Sporobolomyces pararoseus]
MSENLSIVVLNAEGDQFNASLIAEGKQGGVQASTSLYSIASEKLIGNSSLIVYLVADRKKSFTFPDKRIEAFFEGFSSTENPAFVVEPIDSNSFLRVIQLLELYLPLSSVSSIYLGSIHTSQLYPFLISLPFSQKQKINFLSTVTIAPCYKQSLLQQGSSNGGGFNHKSVVNVFENLFGGFLTPDVAAKMLWDSVEVGGKGKEKEESGGGSGRDIWSSSTTTTEGFMMMNETNWRAEDNPMISSTSKTSRLIWDADSDDDLPSWDRESQLQLTPPQSPQPSARPSPMLTPSPKEPVKDQEEEEDVGIVTPESPSVSTRPPESSSILAREVQPLPPRPPPPPTTLAASLLARQGVLNRPIATASANPQPIKPVNSKPVPSNSTSTSTKEVITQTPQGLLSSLPTFPLPQLSFSAYTAPCKRHYLLKEGCPQTAQSCRFSHAFPFTPQEKKLFPLWAKGTVCPDQMRGKCKRGENCYLGHRCFYTFAACPHGNTCKFKVAGLPHSSRK